MRIILSPLAFSEERSTETQYVFIREGKEKNS